MSGQRNQQAVRLLLQALLARHGRRMALGVLLAATTTLAGVLLLGISGWFLAGTAMAGLLGAAAIAFDVFTPSASIRLLALGRTASRYGERVVTHQATLQALVQVRERLFRAYAARGAGDGSRWRLHPGRMLLRLTRDLDAAESLYLRLIVPTAAALCGTLLISLWLAWHHPGLGVASLCWFLLWGFGIVLWLVRSTTRLSLAQSRLAERLRQQSLDLAGAQTELVMANQFDAWLARWQQTEARLAALDAQLQRRDALAAALWQILHALTMAAAAMAAGWLVLQHGMSVPNAAFLLLMAMAGMEPFAAMRRGALEWSASLLAARRLATPLRARPDAETALPLPAAGLVAELQQVSVPGAQQQARVAGVDLRVAQGEIVALIGPSGSGKSTLLALISGELEAGSGSVRAQPAVALPQQPALFHDSVRANVNLQQRALEDAQIWQALDAAGLQEVMAARPEGLDEVLGEGGLGLSRGQARRLALARLFLADSTVWLLDEPTDGLDSTTAADVLQRLGAALQGRTAVIATHMRREAELADRLLVLEAGRVTGDWPRGSAGHAEALARLRDG